MWCASSVGSEETAGCPGLSELAPESCMLAQVSISNMLLSEKGYRKCSKVSPSETGNAQRYLPQRQEMLKGISLRGHFDEFTPVILHRSYTSVC